MKYGACLAILLLSAYVCNVSATILIPKIPAPRVEKLTKINTQAPKLDLCPECVDFMGQFIDQLLNVILSKFK